MEEKRGTSEGEARGENEKYFLWGGKRDGFQRPEVQGTGTVKLTWTKTKIMRKKQRIQLD